jgi:hypothetical protein
VVDQDRLLEKYKRRFKMEEKKEELKAVEQSNTSSQISPFIDDNDTFDIVIKYYKDGKKFFVENITDDFDIAKSCNSIVITVRYPSMADCSSINSRVHILFPNRENWDVRELVQLELVRLMVLIKKWDLKEELSNDSLLKLSPDIIKSIHAQIQKEIGMTGII